MNAETTTKRRQQIRLWHVPMAVIVVLIAAVAAAGCPVRTEELAAWYPATSGENGAQAVLDAASGYVGQLTSKETRFLNRLYRPGRREPIEDEGRVALARLVGNNQGMLERMHTTSGFDYYHYDIDWPSIPGWKIEPLERTGNALMAFETEVTPVMLERVLAGHMCMLLPHFGTAAMTEGGRNRPTIAGLPARRTTSPSRWRGKMGRLGRLLRQVWDRDYRPRTSLV